MMVDYSHVGGSSIVDTILKVGKLLQLSDEPGGIVANVLGRLDPVKL